MKALRLVLGALPTTPAAMVPMATRPCSDRRRVFFERYGIPNFSPFARSKLLRIARADCSDMSIRAPESCQIA